VANTRGHRRHEEHEEHEEHVNHEAWVIPYADMLTLLMALFLVLFAIGRTDAAKSKLAAESFREATGQPSQVVDLGGGEGDTPIDGGTGILDVPETPAVETPAVETSAESPVTTTTIDTGVVATIATVAPPAAVVTDEQIAQAAHEQAVDQANTAIVSLGDVQKTLEDAADANGLGEDLSFRLEARGLVVTILTDKVLFDSGSAQLQDEGLYLLDLVAEALSSVPNQLSIEGHTDSRPISNAKFASNWELSTARATSVLRFLIGRHGLEGTRMQASGYADTRPIDDNSTAGGAARNRRVEVVVLSDVSLQPVLEPDVIAITPDEVPTPEVITIKPDEIPQPAGATAAATGQS
jgi:chemotaxis protein MotB